MCHCYFCYYRHHAKPAIIRHTISNVIMISLNDFIGAGFDFTCFLNVPLLNPSGNNGAYIGGYKGETAKGATVDFSRTVDLGTGNGLDLPTGSSQRTHPSKNVEAEQLLISPDQVPKSVTFPKWAMLCRIRQYDFLKLFRI